MMYENEYCKLVAFEEDHVVNEIEGEIDMFTAEFMKYVQVEHSTSLADALSKC